ncbi:hypothetical protein [Halovenus halobia]|uniref:hypothetical protein n=1 Tax=Halovenus halobia TaxID=3396622 RepID=UPI003F54E60A
MDSNIFLAPCDPGNFERTVLSEINLGDYPDRPEPLANMDTVRFWGAREGTRNRNFFEKMGSDDLVLFYQDGRYIGAGWVGTTFEDEEQWASAIFWKNAPSQLIYTLEGFDPVSVPKAAVNRIFSYQERYNPQGLIRVAESKVTKRPGAIKLALKKYTDKHG